MDVLLQIGLILLSLTILVVIHELGHFWAARIFGMRVEVFSLFLGPKIYGVQRGDTEWRISAVPLGGYVKISGMLDESMDKEALKQPPKDYEFRSKPRWQRLIVMLGGIIMNVILGCIIFIGIKLFKGDVKIPIEKVTYGIDAREGSIAADLGFKSGDKLVAYKGDKIKYLSDVQDPNILVDTDKYFTILRDGKEMRIDVPDDYLDKFTSRKQKSSILFEPNYSSLIQVQDSGYTLVTKSFQPVKGAKKVPRSASLAGIQSFDSIARVDGKPIRLFSDMLEVLSPQKGDTVQVQFYRKGQMMEQSVVVDSIGVLNPIAKFNRIEYDTLYRGIIGIKPVDSVLNVKIEYGFGGAVSAGIGAAFREVSRTLKGLKLLITGKANPSKSLSGPVKISSAMLKGFKSKEGGWGFFWFLTGLLSMVLAVMNLLPIPVLDGGHVLFLLIETAMGRDIPQKIKERSLEVGFVMIIALMGYVILNDIVNY